MDSYLTSILNLNPIGNIAILGFFSNYSVEDYFIENKSALILGKSDHLWAHISSSSTSDLSAAGINTIQKRNTIFLLKTG